MFMIRICLCLLLICASACKKDSGYSVPSGAGVSCPLARNTAAERLHVLNLIHPEDFGSPLTPRKAYDLNAELSKYLACFKCEFSTDPSQIRMMMSASRQDDIFIWALRPDGTFIVSKGPEDQMTHGVIASLDVEHPELTKPPMGTALVGGEGWFDPSTQTLYVNNKSGHYRPEFSRLNNASMRKVLQDIGSLDFLDIKFVDATKPR